MMNRRNFVKGSSLLLCGAMTPLSFANNIPKLDKLTYRIEESTPENDFLSKIIFTKGSVEHFQTLSFNPDNTADDFIDSHGCCVQMEMFSIIRNSFEYGRPFHVGEHCEKIDTLTNEDLKLIFNISYKVCEGHRCCLSKEHQEFVRLKCEGFEL